MDLQSFAEGDGDHPPAYRFAIKTCADRDTVGACSFRVGDAGNRHIRYGGNIGYDIDAPHRGHKYSLKAARLLLALARSHRMDCVRVTCEPENMASRRICELLGAEMTAILDLPVDDYNYIHHGARRHCVYEIRI